MENIEKEEVKKEEYISFEDFSKIILKTAKVVECTKLEDTDKLLKLNVELGEEKRTIVSGLALAYKPEELVGQTVIVVTNLKPRKMRGILSEGMILACGESYTDVPLLTVNKETKSGEQVF